jgi:hypothetical protein
MTTDFPAAYINAERTGLEPVYMRLDRTTSMLMIEIDKDWKRYMSDDGVIIVEVVRALYGLIESAKLWYDEISGTLNICPPLKDLDVVVWIYTAFRRGSRPQRPDLTFKTKI